MKQLSTIHGALVDLADRIKAQIDLVEFNAVHLSHVCNVVDHLESLLNDATICEGQKINEAKLYLFEIRSSLMILFD